MDVLLPSSPSRNSSEITDYQLEMPAWSYGSLQSAAIQLRLHRPHSLAWAILLHALPPPETDIVKSIKSQRNLYNDLRTRLSQDPRASVDDDPLSQKDESAWKQHFCDNELKALILQDVVRTFPDELYFRDKDVQDLMVRVLFYWARSHAMVGYRQGMHEILAPLLFELHLDRMLAPTSLSDTLKYYLDQDFLEHDSYMLFSAVMKGLERFYTTGEAVPSPGGRLPTSNSLHNPNEVVRYLEHVKDEYLSKVDPELSAHLDQCNITMELFGIRWLRLLFGREFSRGEVPALWGFLFADGPMLPYLHYVIVAMLVAVRDTLLSCDAGGALARLMRAGAAPARVVCAHALHLRRPDAHPRPPRPQQRTPPIKPSPTHIIQSTRRVLGGDSSGSDTEGVAEGADVARELATLAVLRARLPAVAAQLAAAGPAVRGPAETLAQLVALLQCRNHALVDVETALEAAEANTNMNSDRIGRRMLVPVALPLKKRSVEQQSTGAKQAPKVKEVPLKLFHQAECVCVNSDFPCLDPLRLRTE